MRQCPRCQTLAERLDLDVALMGSTGFRRRWTAPFRYPVLAIRSAWLVLRRRPRALIVVSPPFIAGLVLVPLARRLGARVAVDLHSAALLDRSWKPFLAIQHWACRAAGAAVVTLPSLAARLEPYGIQTIVLPDPLPEMPGTQAQGPAIPGLGPLVVAVCGWGDDEPIEALVEAARGAAWRLAVTGRPTRRLDLPANVSLTGFLSPPEYPALLRAADAIVVLTTRDDTLLAGAWEALVVERPLVLSGTAALRATFGPDLTYVAPDADSIRSGVEQVLADPERARDVTVQLRKRFATENERAIAALAAHLATG
jgi:glycosyltransferase involved in cell wall biosynthesis